MSRRGIMLVGILLALMGLLGAIALRPWATNPQGSGDAPFGNADTKIVDTHFGRLRMQVLEAPVETPTGIYTFLAMPEGELVWADGLGRIYSVGDGAAFSRLDVSIDLNRERFLQDAAELKPGLQTHRFSVKDVHAHGGSLYVSHHYWRAPERCYTLRLSEVPVGPARKGRDRWGAPEVVFESSPCLPIDTVVYDGQLMEAGGRIASLGDELLLTVGDNAHDGRRLGEEARPGPGRAPLFSQDPSVDYGKVIRIDPETRTASVFSTGHRNPQGLFVDPSGSILSTEHGPRGGDELNVLQPGGNYGWPLVTLGTEYGEYRWDLNAANGEHVGYEPPLFSWIPSIGISAVTRVVAGPFPEWKDDILVSSLKARSLFRVRVRQRRVLGVEAIPLGIPIRDLLETPDGRIVLSTTNRTILVLENDGGGGRTPGLAPRSQVEFAGATALGRALYEARCSYCHEAGSAARASGPSLQGMFDSGAAESDRDFPYSRALRESGVRWSDPETLDRWLASPHALVPGTSMLFEGLPDPEDRAMLSAYLEDRFR